MKRVAGLLLVLIPLYADSWTPEFSLKFQNVGQAVPSPDGKWVAYTQSQNIVDPEHSEMRPQVYIATADGSRRLQLTRGEKGCDSPAFSPDSTFVYFVSHRCGKRNVYRLDVRRGRAAQVT